MLFNSPEFIVFLPIVFGIYWYLSKLSLRIQNFFLIIASYVFYGWWDWRFLFLIIISSMTDYLIGLGLSSEKNTGKRKLLLYASLLVNLGLLGVFKYYNFFIDNFIVFSHSLGFTVNPSSLSVILPVGISFYTFQTLSYTIDIYNKKIEPTSDIIAFFAFVCFFPQLVAGPIERAKNLLPQFLKRREFNYYDSIDGIKQAVWGLFKKVVIADSCAYYVDSIFNNYTMYSGSELFIGVILFAFQIYGDFSGYSDIAIGVAKLFGFNLMRNFAYPYFSRDIAEFWRRWHISLSTWFRDYVYIPLGGSFTNKPNQIRNIIITFTVSGFWHGANWTFITWGFLNGLYYIPLMLVGKQRKYKKSKENEENIANIKDIPKIVVTFLFTLLAWIFFRAESISQALSYINNIFSKSFFTIPDLNTIPVITSIVILVIAEWIQRDKQHVLQFDKLRFPTRIMIYYTVSILVLICAGEAKSFIYFQF